MSEQLTPSHEFDPLKADVEAALLAAFGEDAVGWLDEAEAEDQQSQQDAFVEPQNDGLSKGETLAEFNAKLNEMLLAATSGNGSSAPRENDSIAGPRYVVFVVGEQQYGVPLDRVLEIERCGKVTPLPRTPAWLRGITSLRGEILSVTDCRDLMGLNDQRRGVAEKIIIVHSEIHQSQTALVVDRVLGIRNLRGDRDLLDGLSDRLADFASSIAVSEQAMTVLIDPDLLLGSKELAAFAVG